MTTPSPWGRVGGWRVALAGTFPTSPLRTVRDRFRVTRLSGGIHAPVQPLHISCASPLAWPSTWTASPCAWLSHAPRWGMTPTTTISPPSPSSSRKEGDPAFRHDATSEHAVGHPLISLPGLIDHRPGQRGCERRESFPFAHPGTGLRRATGGGGSPRLEIGFQTIQSYPYRAGLAAPQPLTSWAEHRAHGRLLSPLGFPARSAGDPGTLLSVPPGCTRDSIMRDAAHARAL